MGIVAAAVLIVVVLVLVELHMGGFEHDFQRRRWRERRFNLDAGSGLHVRRAGGGVVGGRAVARSWPLGSFAFSPVRPYTCLCAGACSSSPGRALTPAASMLGLHVWYLWQRDVWRREFRGTEFEKNVFFESISRYIARSPVEGDWLVTVEAAR